VVLASRYPDPVPQFFLLLLSGTLYPDPVPQFFLLLLSGTLYLDPVPRSCIPVVLCLVLHFYNGEEEVSC
jgi:hypothetical protein